MSYKLSKKLPSQETYGLASQLQRASVSVAANIAEGHGRSQLGEYLQHLSVAHGSLMELETHLLIAQRLGYLPATEVGTTMETANITGGMLGNLIQSLQRLKKARAS